MDIKRNHSRKRDAIYAALRSTREHPAAEQVYARLKPDFPDLSLATVYRNLALFLDEGQAISVGTVNGQERFDADVSPHAHFVCTVCGRVLDVEEPEPARLDRLAGERMNALITGHRLTYSGVCEDCLKAREGV